MAQERAGEGPPSSYGLGPGDRFISHSYFCSCTDAATLQKISDRLGPAAVQSFFTRWFSRLPSPFTEADIRAGYGYDLALASSKFPILAFSTVRKRAGWG